MFQKNSADAQLQRTEWTVGNVKRVAWVHLPARTTGAPVVFVWHGHGQNPIAVVRGFSLHTLWPEAIIMYPQGLPTPGRRSDAKGRLPGWQFQPGQFENRDIAFYDEMLKSCIEKWNADPKRILSVGHSNGARLTYLLWALRGNTLAGVAAIATTADGLLSSLKPKPCLHVAGEIDSLVAFKLQQETMESIKKLNGVNGETGEVWDKRRIQTVTFYPSKNRTPFVEYKFAGGHELPVYAPRLITRFFKQIV